MPNLILKLSTKSKITGHYLVAVGEILIMNKQEYNTGGISALMQLDRTYAKKEFMRAYSMMTIRLFTSS